MITYYPEIQPMKKLINFCKNFRKKDKEIRHAFIGMGIVLVVLIIGTVLGNIIVPGTAIGIAAMIASLGFLIFMLSMIQLVEKNVINFIDKKLTGKQRNE